MVGVHQVEALFVIWPVGGRDATVAVFVCLPELGQRLGGHQLQPARAVFATSQGAVPVGVQVGEAAPGRDLTSGKGAIAVGVRREGSLLHPQGGGEFVAFVPGRSAIAGEHLELREREVAVKVGICQRHEHSRIARENDG